MSRTDGASLLAGVVASLVLAGCGASEESRVLSAVRGLVAALSGAAGAGPAQPAPAGEEPLPGAERLPAMADAGEGPERQAVLIEGGEFSSLEERRPPETEVPLYGYVDANGVTKMVRGLHSVPEGYRSRARRLSKASMPVVNRYESKPLPTRRGIANAVPGNRSHGGVVLYAAEWCGACRKTRAFLDREGVAYELRDIDQDPRARDEVRRILGGVRIPLLDIEGTYVSGFAPDAIRRALRESG